MQSGRLSPPSCSACSALSQRASLPPPAGVAHWETTEQQALELLRQGVRFTVEHPEASAAAGAAAFFLLVPGPRRFLFRQTLGR